ncbi:MAG: SGNH hydrolase domain-containing protein, partial [Candidatus Nanopelagicales bacterium]
PTGCFGAAAIDNNCQNPFAPVSQGAALAGHNDLPMASRKPRCSDDLGPFSQVLCYYGDPAGTKTLLLWGNSHAAAWSDAIDEVGKRLKMKVVVASRSGCPASTQPPPPNELRENTAEELAGCKQRNEWVLSTLVPQADVVVMADLRAGYADGSRPLDGFVEAIDRIRAAGKQVIWLSDVPLTDGVVSRRDGPECLQQFGQCTNPVDRALLAQVVTTRVSERVPDLDTIDVSSRFCDDTQCYSAVGGVSVYFDGLHLSGTYSRSIGPWLARQIGTCLKDSKACVHTP